MPNTLNTASIIAKAAVKILDNELGMGSRVHRGYEEEFSKNVNGYKVGDTVNIRKPAQFRVRTGLVASNQDVIEGKTAITVNKVAGVDFSFSSTDLALNIADLSERVIKPAMVPVANQIDQDIHACALTNFWNWVGTPGNTISSYTKFLAGVQRLNEMAVPTDERSSALSPADHVALLGAQSQLYIDGANSDAYRKAKLGGLAGVEPFMTQNAPTLTTGTRTNGTVNGAGQAVTYSGAQANSWGQTLNVAGLGAAATVRAGEVFSIAGVFAVNPVTKQVLPYLQQFVATATATADGSGNAAVQIAPAIITTGAYQTVSAAPAAGAVVTWNGAASTTFQQNLMFHKNALALVVVPFEKPAGVPTDQIGMHTYKGMSLMLVPYFDGTNRISNWRLDVLYGVAAIDPRLGTRVSG
ncbi:P22 phage major capsid protein family protein [Methylobacterium brachythecii]|uniref:P22 coat-protein 5 family protein n=1 Tax=Methylobacterium brachythecii TaxID=1176177 RepID=A0A7W6AKH6_9HYPH|nr:P22 phage major capsid protein family protein [Methylobacterium brachythecii]MBB3905123.1 hypothetical protein [Methylobacterium brachythecii]GLS44369.1 hypothetical protein GCM10007884_23570 [Methylobacterium brachythecii]